MKFNIIGKSLIIGLRYHIRLHAILNDVVCATILAYMREIGDLLALVYCNFFKKVRLGGWGILRKKAPTLCLYNRG